MLRTIGRYVGRSRQANEFRAQFDEAMREAELDQLRKEVAALKSEAESSLGAPSSRCRASWRRPERSSTVPLEAGDHILHRTVASATASTPETINGSGQRSGLNGSAVEQPRVAETDQSAKSGSVTSG